MMASGKSKVEAHLQEIAEMEIPVYVLIDELTVLSDCRLVYDEENRKELIIKAKPGHYPVKVRLKLTYANLRTLYSFKSEIISQKNIDGSALLSIRIPETITKDERRRCFRVKPSEEIPVCIRIPLDDKMVIDTEAVDIASRGVSFVAPDNIGPFHIGNALPLTVSIPGFGDIQIEASVRNIEKMHEMTRIGMEFSEMSETEQRKIIQYVTNRELEIRNQTREEQLEKKPIVCIVDDDQNDDRYDFLKYTYEVFATDHFNLVTKLLAHLPDLIVINCDIPEILILLRIIARHHILKGIPVVLTGTEKECPNGAPVKTVYFSSPFKEKLFLKTLEDLIDKCALLKKLDENKFRIIPTKPVKILIIDRFANLGTDNIGALKKYGFHVSIHGNEKNILEKIESNYPDIIIFDEQTEKIDPPSMCSLLNMNKTIKCIPKIILTKEEKTFEIFFSRGFCCGFIKKPVDPQAMIATINKTIKNLWS